jgi:hypothetical protein
MGKCVICGGLGVSDAYYCKECVLQEKDASDFVIFVILLARWMSKDCEFRQR